MIDENIFMPSVAIFTVVGALKNKISTTTIWKLRREWIKEEKVARDRLEVKISVNRVNIWSASLH